MGKSIRTTSNTQTPTQTSPLFSAGDVALCPSIANSSDKDSTKAWATLLLDQAESINKPLAMTGYGKEGKQ
ncbi:hypothetical protein [Psychrobacter sp. S1-30-MNA-CIBAN-0213]|uniref:hypothetical protein n=1 Tax=Psychrobacter sp. S1-30-MNA-CIBAN-0213 TaxID=3140456 RepID=UPI0033206FEC